MQISISVWAKTDNIDAFEPERGHVGAPIKIDKNQVGLVFFRFFGGVDEGDSVAEATAVEQIGYVSDDHWGNAFGREQRVY